MDTTNRENYIGVARMIVEKLGGVSELERMSMSPKANAVGIGRIPKTTVGKWVQSGVVPEKYREILLVLAKLFDKPHYATDYIAYLLPVRG